MAYTDFHVNGPAIVSTKMASESAYSDLGITVDGVEPSFDGKYEDVIADDGGPMVPVDLQYFGEEARIRLELIRWDETRMRLVETRIAGKTVGQIRAVDLGTLVVRASHYFALSIATSARTGLSAENGYRFPVCHAVDSIPFKLGTRVTRKTLLIRAIPSVAGVLYERF